MPDDRVLLVYAHPDDETVAGGLLGRFREADVPVHALFLTQGEGSAHHLVNPARDDPALALSRLRPEEVRLAAAFHDFRSLTVLGQPDRGLTTDADAFLASGTWRLPEIEEALAALADRVRPTLVLTFLPRHPAVHAHHQVAARLALHLQAEGRLGGHVAGIYGSLELGWIEATRFTRELPHCLRFSRTRRSASFDLSWGEYQRLGASFHQSQEAGRRTILEDECLLPLYERAENPPTLLRLWAMAEAAQARPDAGILPEPPSSTPVV